jgi:hypothetical protein
LKGKGVASKTAKGKGPGAAAKGAAAATRKAKAGASPPRVASKSPPRVAASAGKGGPFFKRPAAAVKNAADKSVVDTPRHKSRASRATAQAKH